MQALYHTHMVSLRSPWLKVSLDLRLTNPACRRVRDSCPSNPYGSSDTSSVATSCINNFFDGVGIPSIVAASFLRGVLGGRHTRWRSCARVLFTFVSISIFHSIGFPPTAQLASVPNVNSSLLLSQSRTTAEGMI